MGLENWCESTQVASRCILKQSTVKVLAPDEGKSLTKPTATWGTSLGLSSPKWCQSFDLVEIAHIGSVAPKNRKLELLFEVEPIAQTMLPLVREERTDQ